MRFVLLFALLVSSAMAECTRGYRAGTIYVTHSALGIAPRMPETGLAPGSLFDVQIEALFACGQLEAMDPVTLRFRAAGAQDAVELRVVETLSFGDHPFGFTAVIPADAAAGEGELCVVGGEAKTFTTPVWIASTNFGIFMRTKPQVWRDGPQDVRLTAPVRSGELVTIRGTGLGRAAPSNIAVEVAGTRVPAEFAGAVPERPGVDQINFRFPGSVPDDCYIGVTVDVGGRRSNIASVPAGAGDGPCHHRLGLSPEDLARLDQGGSVPLSRTWVDSNVVPNPETAGRYYRYDSVTLEFRPVAAEDVQSAAGVLAPDSPRSGCALSTAGAYAFLIVVPRPLDSGIPVLIGPDGKSWQMSGSLYYSTPPPEPDQSYELNDIPPSIFEPGEWAIEVAGGRDIARFRIPFELPPRLRWTNRTQLGLTLLSRASDVTLTWDAAGYTPREHVNASLFAGQALISCDAAATDGSITIPASLIARLPNEPGTTAMLSLHLGPATYPATVYAVPLVRGGSFAGVMNWSYLESVRLTWD